LLAHGINHGIKLVDSPVLQYLYYLAQIGIALSPLAEDSIYCKLEKNPLVEYFKQGLNVSLSTDNPLQIHITEEALIEEYSVASKYWRLSGVDLCELARNSVLQSGFEHLRKVQWLGESYYKIGVSGNDVRKSNVPNERISFRIERLCYESNFIHKIVRYFGDPFLYEKQDSWKGTSTPIDRSSIIEHKRKVTDDHFV